MTAMQRINHSTGFVLVHDEDHEHWSFRARPDGVVEVLGNLGYVGPVPDVTDNPPPNYGAVHTIAYTEFNDDVAHGLRKVIVQHLERYGECSIYLGDGGEHPRELRNWASAGAPDPYSELEGTDDLTEDDVPAEPGTEGPSEVQEVLESGVLPDGTAPETEPGVNDEAEVLAEATEDDVPADQLPEDVGLEDAYTDDDGFPVEDDREPSADDTPAEVGQAGGETGDAEGDHAPDTHLGGTTSYDEPAE
jgi:hypothetical protein